MNEATLETAANVLRGDMMTAESDALPHTGDGLCWTGKPEVMQFDFITAPQRALKKPDVGLAA